jgi:hypothetical protein
MHENETFVVIYFTKSLYYVIEFTYFDDFSIFPRCIQLPLFNLSVITRNTWTNADLNL